MKTEFKLMVPKSPKDQDSGFMLRIIGQEPKHKPYVSVDFQSHESVYVIKDRDLELLAVNILKSLNSKRLKK